MSNDDRLFFAIFALFGGVFAVIGLGIACVGLLPTFWPEVPGRLLSAGVGRHVGTHEGVQDVSYYPKVRYVYSVGGQEYEGKRYTRVQQGSSREAAQRKVDALNELLAAEGVITLRYHPRNPAVSVMTVNPSPLGFIFASTGSLFCFIGLACGSEAKKRKRVFGCMAGGHAVGLLCALAGEFLHSELMRPVFWWVLCLWMLALVLSYCIGVRRPRARHGAPPTPDPPGPWS